MEGGGSVRDGDGVGSAAVGGEFLLECGGDRTLGDHAGGKDGEDGIVLLVSERRLGDRYVHGILRKQMRISFRVVLYTGFVFGGWG